MQTCNKFINVSPESTRLYRPFHWFSTQIALDVMKVTSVCLIKTLCLHPLSLHPPCLAMKVLKKAASTGLQNPTPSQVQATEEVLAPSAKQLSLQLQQPGGPLPQGPWHGEPRQVKRQSDGWDVYSKARLGLFGKDTWIFATKKQSLGKEAA